LVARVEEPVTFRKGEHRIVVSQLGERAEVISERLHKGVEQAKKNIQEESSLFRKEESGGAQNKSPNRDGQPRNESGVTKGWYMKRGTNGLLKKCTFRVRKKKSVWDGGKEGKLASSVGMGNGKEHPYPLWTEADWKHGGKTKLQHHAAIKETSGVNGIRFDGMEKGDLSKRCSSKKNSKRKTVQGEGGGLKGASPRVKIQRGKQSTAKTPE